MITKITTSFILLNFLLIPYLSFGQDSNCETQEWEWAQQLTTGLYFSEVSSIQHDSLDNLYIGGHYNAQLTLGDTTLYAGPPNNLAYHRSDFLAKFNAYGSLIWAKNVGISDQIDQIYLRLGNNELVVVQHSDSIYVSKYSLAGEIKWKKSVGVLREGSTSSLEVDKSGNIYLGGYFKDVATFSNEVLTSPNEQRGFISKFGEDATFTWALGVASNGGSEIADLALNSKGEIFAVGYFYGSIKYGTDSIQTIRSLVHNAMMMKYNSKGEYILMEHVAKAPIESYGQSITLDRKENVLIGGIFVTDDDFEADTAITLIGTDRYTFNGSFIAKYDENGLFIWSERVHELYQSLIEGLEVDSANNTYVAVNDFIHTLYKYTENGAQLWNKPITSFNYNSGSLLIDLNTKEELVITGRFNEAINLGNITLNPLNENDYYLAKLSVSASVLPPKVSPSKIESNSVTATRVNVSWENGDGTGRLVLLKKLGKVSPSNIEDGIVYNDGAGEFGSGTQTDEREFVVYAGSGSEITITGLQKGRPYQVAVIEYNDSTVCQNQINYLQEDVAKKFFVTGGLVSAFSAYPNPISQEALTVQLPDNTSGEDFLILSDAFGKEIMKRKVKKLPLQDGALIVDLSSLNLSSGIYYLRLTGQPAIRLIRK